MTIKKLLILIITLSIAFLSCERKVDPPIYCVNRIIQSPDSIIISQSDYAQACYLFEYNELDYSDLQFIKFSVDELNYKNVLCYQFLNGLKIFTQKMGYLFYENSSIRWISSNKIESIDLYSKPLMIHDSVVKKYIDKVIHDTDFISSFTPKELNDFLYGCFNLEFGYYDLNAGIPDVDKIFTTAWYVIPSGSSSPFPRAYINDKTGEIIEYYNGIEINR